MSIVPKLSSTEKEDLILKGINKYRKSVNVSELAENDKASCLADEIADDLEDQPCSGADKFADDPTRTVTELVNFPKLAQKCDINITTTTDGVILPVCVPDLVYDLVLGNYTHSPYKKFLKDSKYSGAGVGSEGAWIVVVLTTDEPTGSFSAASSLAAFGVVQALVVSILGSVVALLY